MRAHTFYNVGHGDSIVIEDENQLVVRDLGLFSKKKPFYNSCLNLAIHDIETNKKRKCAIISHAHDDHFNGFTDLFNRNNFQIFEESYIPPLVKYNGAFFQHPTNKLSNTFIRLLKNKIQRYIILYASLPSNSTIKKYISNWFFLLPIMHFLSKKIAMVSCGDQILNKTATILWPPLPQSIKDNITINSEIKNHLIIINDDIDSNLTRMDISQDIIHSFDEEVNEIINIFVQILEGNENDEEKRKNFVDKIDVLLKNIDKRKQLSLSSRTKHLFCTAIKKDDDNMSLIFQYNDASAIYLSDITERHIPKLISIMNNNNMVLPEYILLKSSHHGSRYHNSLKAIRNEYVVHTCGIGISRGWRAHKGPNNGYTKGIQNTFCMDWDFTAMRNYPKKWDKNVLNNSTICTPYQKLTFII